MLDKGDGILAQARHTKEYGTISHIQLAAANRPLFSLLINKRPICHKRPLQCRDEAIIKARQTLQRASQQCKVTEKLKKDESKFSFNA